MSGVSPQPKDSLATALAEILLAYLAVIMAGFTVLTHVSQILGVPFRAYAVVAISLALSLSVISVFAARWRLRQVSHYDRKTVLVLVSAGLLCSTLAVINHRSDADDYYYTPNVVYMLGNQGERGGFGDEPRMGFDIHYLDGGENCRIVSHSWATAIPFEYAQGALAAVLRVDFLSIYYLIVPALVGFSIPLGLYYALSHFSRRTMTAAMGMLITVGIVFLLGETQQTYGSFSVTRAYQGKTLLLSVGIPVFIGMSLSFLRSPSVYYWAILSALATAMVGATTSTIVVLPALASLLAIASVFGSERKPRSAVYVVYVASLWYALLYALFLVINSEGNLGIDSPVNQGWPTTFLGQLKLFVAGLPATPVALAVASLVAVCLASGRQRRFLVAWMLAAVALYLNPLVAPLLIEHLTSPNLYWRLFYIYPFPLVIGIATIHLVGRTESLGRRGRAMLAGIALLLLVGAHLLPFSTSAFRGETTFRFPPGYKLPVELVPVAQEIVSQTPAGTMLAPPGLSGVIPMLSADHPQVRVRTTGVRLWLGGCGLAEQAETRIRASEFVGGDGTRYYPDFVRFLETEGKLVRSVVLRTALLEDARVQRMLETYGFAPQRIISDEYSAAWR